MLDDMTWCLPSSRQQAEGGGDAKQMNNHPTVSKSIIYR
jgi:hypothetical protein